MTLLWLGHYYYIHSSYNIHSSYDTRDYYDTIIILLCHTMTGYQHPVNWNVTADRKLSSWPEPWPWHSGWEMIIKWPWSSERDFNQLEGAHEEWTAAGVSGQVLLYTLFFSSNSLFQLPVQDCCFSKKVLRTADMRATIPGVTSRWWNTKKAVLEARRAETVQCCDHYFSLWHYYFTYYWNW